MISSDIICFLAPPLHHGTCFTDNHVKKTLDTTYKSPRPDSLIVKSH